MTLLLYILVCSVLSILGSSSPIVPQDNPSTLFSPGVVSNTTVLSPLSTKSELPQLKLEHVLNSDNLDLRCGSSFGRTPLGSCVDAIRQMPRTLPDDPHRDPPRSYGPRGPASYDVELPKRWISCMCNLVSVAWLPSIHAFFPPRI